MARTAASPLAPNALSHARAGRRARSLWGDALRRLIRNRLAFASAVLIIAFMLIALFAPLLSPYGYAEQNYDVVTQPPSAAFPLGTDQLGRDILSRLFFGARVSLAVGLIV